MKTFVVAYHCTYTGVFNLTKVTAESDLEALKVVYILNSDSDSEYDEYHAAINGAATIEAFFELLADEEMMKVLEI